MNDPDPNSPQPNPYPWLRPMPTMWFCVIACIALIVLGTWLSRQSKPPAAQVTPKTAPAEGSSLLRSVGGDLV